MKKTAIILAMAGLLTACGGGGGGSASAPTATATLSGANQTTVAQDTAASSFMPMQGAQMVAGAAITDESVVFALAREQMGKLSDYMAQAKANSMMGGAVASTTVTCPTSGSLTVSVTDADGSGTVSAGDSLNISFSSCVVPSGSLTGTLDFAVNSLSATSATNYTMGMTLTFGAFTVNAPQFTASANGSLSINLTKTATYAWTETVSSPSLTVSGTYMGVTRTRTLANYSATATRVPDATYTYTTSYILSGAVTSTALNNQTFLFATNTAFVKHGIDYYPGMGQMVITGANSSKLRVTAISNTQATLELDATGGGTYGAPTTVNWSDLI